MKPRNFIALLLLLVMGSITACQTNLSLAPTSSDLSTRTFTPTNTLSPVFTATPTFTFTNTFSFTPIFTTTSSFTVTKTFIPTPTFTSTPTFTPSFTPTSTPTGMPGLDWYESAAVASFPGRSFHSSVVYNGSMWVIAGNGNSGTLNDVWSSPNGTTWSAATTAAAFVARYGQTALVYGAPSSMFVIGGYDGVTPFRNDVWGSTDGVNWNQVTAAAAFTARYGQGSVVFGGKMWVIGGFDSTYAFKNDVWSSTDGANWTLVNGAAPFTGRAGLAAVVYGSPASIYVIAGYDNVAPRTNDVWSSPDGNTWNAVTMTAAFAGREEPTALSYNNALWVIGGRTGAGLMNDVWTSTDGANWTTVAAASVFTPRYQHTSVVFNNGAVSAMWVIAGFSGVYDADVWHSP